MAIDRIIYKSSFSKGNQPQWSCPTCSKGILVGLKGSFHYEELSESRNARSHSDWDPDWIVYTYSCVLKCANPNCREVVSSVGVGHVDYDPIFEDDGSEHPTGVEYYDCFVPKFFHPHLKIFNIPKKVPDYISLEIEKSFELFFADPHSAANHIRTALEKILDYLKVRKYRNIKGKRIGISLHKRIGLLQKKYTQFEKQFLAIKWLGNTGSHGSQITIDDIIDSYEILDYLLDELFDQKSRSIEKLSRTINKKRGPRKSALNT